MQQFACAALRFHMHLQLTLSNQCPREHPKKRGEIALAGTIRPYQNSKFARLEASQVSDRLEASKGDIRQSRFHTLRIYRVPTGGKLPACRGGWSKVGRIRAAAPGNERTTERPLPALRRRSG